MAKRRGRGDGGIEVLPSGRYRATYCRVVSGERVRETSTHRTKSEALEWLRSRSQAGPSQPGTLSDWLDQWLPLHKSQVAPNTFRTNDARVRKHIRPGLGAVRLRDLTPIVVEGWLVQFRAEHGQGETHRVGKVLRACLYAAVKKGVIPVSPFSHSRVNLPAEPHGSNRALDRDELRKLIEAAGEHAWVIRLWVDLGCRPGEMLGLKWQDFGGKSVSIVRSLDITTGKLRETKTKRSRRTLPISQANAAALAELRAIRTPSPETAIVEAPRSKSSHWWLRNFDRNRFRPIVTASGLEGVTMYTLRHTCATLLLQAGVSIKVVSERLGHEDVTTTLRTYSHVMPGDQERAAAVMGDILG